VPAYVVAGLTRTRAAILLTTLVAAITLYGLYRFAADTAAAQSNLLLNPHFEPSAAETWRSLDSNHGHWSVEEAQAPVADVRPDAPFRPVKLEVQGAEEGSWTGFGQRLGAEPGGDYRIAVRYKFPKGSGAASLIVRVQQFNAQGEVIPEPDSENAAFLLDEWLPTADDWSPWAHDFRPDERATSLDVTFTLLGYNGATAWIAAPQLYLTPAMPGPRAPWLMLGSLVSLAFVLSLGQRWTLVGYRRLLAGRRLAEVQRWRWLVKLVLVLLVFGGLFLLVRRWLLSDYFSLPQFAREPQKALYTEVISLVFAVMAASGLWGTWRADANRRLAVWSFIIFLGSLTLLAKVFFFQKYLFADENVYAVIGWRWAEGDIPYLHTWNDKPPGLFAIGAMTFLFLPRTRLSLWLSESIWAVLSVLAFFFLARRFFFSTRLSAATAALFTILLNASFFQPGLLTTYYMPLCSISCVFCILLFLEKRRASFLFMAGASAALFLLFKQTAVPFVGLAGLFLLFHEMSLAPKFSCRISWRAALYFSLGLLAVVSIVVVYFTALGALASTFEALTSTSKSVGQRIAPASLFDYLGRQLNDLAPSLLFWCLALPGMIALAWPVPPQEAGELSHSRRQETLLLLWFVGDAVGVALAGKFFPHFFLQLTPSLALVIGYGLWGLDRLLNKARLNHTFERLLLAVAFALALPFLIHTPPEDLLSNTDAFVDFLAGHEANYEGRLSSITSFITRATSDDDSILVWGKHEWAEVYLFSGRRPASRFFYFWPAFFFPDSPDRVTAEVVFYRQQFMQQLEDAQPKIIGLAGRQEGDSLVYDTEGVDALRTFIEEHYTLAKELPGFLIFQRRER
jgi:4-amino-4-deoxy-L-arabinose transferase-like glycosyltransferase